MTARLIASHSRRQPWGFFAILFFLFTLLILIIKPLVSVSWKDAAVLLAGNFIVFAATIGSFILYHKSLRNNQVHYFMRMIYSAMFFKMIVCMAAVLIYALIVKNQISKIGILGSFIFYFIYTFVEVRTLMQMSKQQKDA